MKAYAHANYLPVKVGQELVVESEGVDWYRVRHNGKQLYVPKAVFKTYKPKVNRESDD